MPSLWAQACRPLTSSGSAQAGARHDDDLVCIAILDELGDGRETALFERDGRDAVDGLVVAHRAGFPPAAGVPIGLRPVLLVTSSASATYFGGW